MDGWQNAYTYTQDTYPVSDGHIQYEIGSKLDLSDGRYDVTTEEGKYQVWLALANLQNSFNKYTIIVGYIGDRIPMKHNYTLGFTFGAPATVVAYGKEDKNGGAMTLAHEIAHCYMVGDEYQGGSYNLNSNTPPYGFEGRIMNTATPVTANVAGVPNAADIGKSQTGTYIDSSFNPVNTTNYRVWKTGDHPLGFMNNGGAGDDSYWITGEIWNQLYHSLAIYSGKENGSKAASHGAQQYTMTCSGCYSQLDGKDVTWEYICTGCYYTYAEPSCPDCGEIPDSWSNRVYRCPECDHQFLYYGVQSSISSMAALAQSMGEEEVEEIVYEECRAIDIRGLIREDGFTPLPFYTYDSSTEYLSEALNGNYSVKITDKNGKLLSMAKFEPSFLANSNPPQLLKEVPIDLAVKWSEEAAKISIYYKEKEIWFTDVSEQIPEVEFTWSQDQVEGTTTITWEAEDGDSDQLYYELWYGYGEEGFDNIVTDYQENSITLDMDQYPGTENGIFYLYVSDGINTGETCTEEFTCEYKPPFLYESEERNTEYKITEEVYLTVDVYDMQDGWLEDSIVWYREDGEEFITGSSLWIYPYEVGAGEHTFLMEGTNSAGLTVEKSYTITIIEAMSVS